ncbi:MAG: FAD-binding oxidoreductase [Candidatus Nomurabacteria bacterium]|nr:MAG: FAD-binding oxidoreductase [Candidatus Nomurabacteria bacterium]
MSKVSEYLNEHLQGELSTNEQVRRAFSTDGSVLSIMPDMVVYPRTTSDLRKVARFCWQLSEKGHKLPITMRGGGTDQTGAAIGSGVIVNTTAHMDTIFEIDVKQRLVRAQPGATFRTLNQALRVQGLYIPSFPASQSFSTIGGAIANNASGVLSGRFGSTMEWVKQLEIVLSNGEILQTGRLSKRDLERKKGQQTFEGEIYRNIDNLIIDNDKVIDSLAIDVRDNVGYNIVDVKRRDGSFDLTPIFIGSQGTLGIISEVILKAEASSGPPLVGAIAFNDFESARDGMEVLAGLNPTLLEYVDNRLLEKATANGNRYPFYTEALEADKVAAVVVMEFDEPHDRAKKKIAKKVAKLFKDKPSHLVLENDELIAAELRLIANLPTMALVPDKSNDSDPGVLHGAYIPPERFEDFTHGVEKLEKKYHVDLPLWGHVTQSVFHARLLLDLTKPSERHKVLKLLAEWGVLVAENGGHLIGEAAEGRLKAAFAYKDMSDEMKKLYADIRDIFDPMGMMNTGVKQSVDLKKLIDELRTNYDIASFAGYVEGE